MLFSQVFVIQLLFSNGSEVANAAHSTALYISRDNPVDYNKKFGAHSHLPGNGLYSICSLMVLWFLEAI